MLKNHGSLTDRVAEILIDRIVSGVYPVGSKLPAGRLLSREFDVSAAVIREATERLRTKGLVRTRQGAGCIVLTDAMNGGFMLEVSTQSGLSALLHIYELRLGLEGEAAALAAERATREDLAEMSDVLVRLKDSLHEPERAVEWDFAFHRTLAQATHNPHYPQLLTYLSTQWRHSVEVARRNTLAAETGATAGRRSETNREGEPHVATSVAQVRTEDVHREHEAIFEAVQRRDPKRARHHAQEHLKKACARLGLNITTLA